MNSRLRTEIREYAKAAIGMAFGAALLAFAELCVLAHYNFFLIKKADAQERAEREEMYQRFAVSPIDEFGGLDQ